MDKSYPLNKNYYSNNGNVYLRDISSPLKTPLPTKNPSNKGFPFPTLKFRISQVSGRPLWLKIKSNGDHNDIQQFNLVTFCKIHNMRPTNLLSIILDHNRLTGPNFIDWLKNLIVVLGPEKILYVRVKESVMKLRH